MSSLKKIAAANGVDAVKQLPAIINILNVKAREELLKQLVVLKPVNPVIFSIPGIGDIKDLQFVESFIDYRTARIQDKEYLDQILFYIRLCQW